MKVYLFNSKYNAKKASKIDFEIQSNNQRLEFSAIEFHPVQDLPGNKNLFGALINLGSDIIPIDNVKISGYILDNQHYDGFVDDISLENLIKLDPKKINFINKDLKMKDFSLYPQKLNKEDWICKCAAINNTNVCSECGLDKACFYLDHTNPIDKYISEQLKQEVVEFNPQLDLTSNLNYHFHKLSSLGIDYKEHVSEIELKNYEDEYLQVQERNLASLDKNKLSFDLKISFKENINKFLNSLNLNEEFSQRVFTDEELINLKTEYDQAFDLKKRKRKKKVTLILLSTILLVFSLFMLAFGFDYIKYAKANYKLKKGNYSEARIQFEALDGFLDSESLVDESNYQLSLDGFDKHPLVAIEMMGDLKEIDYKDAEKKEKDLMIDYGHKLFGDKKYKSAIEWFKKSGYKKEEVLLESYYLLAQNYYVEKDLENALKYIGKASYYSYKDSKDLELKFVLEYSKPILSESSGFVHYKKAINQLNKVKSRSSEADNLYKLANYDYAEDYFKQNDYKKALFYYKNIKGYSNTNSRIKAIEDVIYAWEVDVVANNSENSKSDYDSLSVYDDWYFHVNLTGGKPGEAIMLKYSGLFPDGEVINDVWDFSLHNNSDTWASFHYTSPSYGAKGNFIFKVYNEKTGELLASKTVRLK